MKFKLFTILILFGYLGTSQNNNEQIASIEKMAKFQVLRLESTHGKIEIEDFCIIDSMISSKFFKTKILNQIGFKSYLFVEVSFAEVDFFEFHTKGIDVENLFYNRFILAYDIINKRFYKLNGFLNNEFPIFYKSVILKSDARVKKILPKKNRKSIKYFKKHFTVSGLELDILVENIEDINNWKIPVLRPSASRLFIDQYGNYDIL